MKRKITTTAFVLTGLLFMVSCSNVNIDDVNTDLQSGTWRITFFEDSGNDETSHFSGYNFTFAATNVVTATNGTNTYTGMWSAQEDDDTPKLVLSGFPDQGSFGELNDDWHITQSSDKKIEMKHESGGNGDTNYLTLEKN